MGGHRAIGDQGLVDQMEGVSGAPDVTAAATDRPGGARQRLLAGGHGSSMSEQVQPVGQAGGRGGGGGQGNRLRSSMLASIPASILNYIRHQSGNPSRIPEKIGHALGAHARDELGISEAFSARPI